MVHFLAKWTLWGTFHRWRLMPDWGRSFRDSLDVQPPPPLWPLFFYYVLVLASMSNFFSSIILTSKLLKIINFIYRYKHISYEMKTQDNNWPQTSFFSSCYFLYRHVVYHLKAQNNIIPKKGLKFKKEVNWLHDLSWPHLTFNLYLLQACCISNESKGQQYSWSAVQGDVLNLCLCCQVVCRWVGPRNHPVPEIMYWCMHRLFQRGCSIPAKWALKLNNAAILK